MDYIHHYDSPLGGITMASDGQALIGLWFDGQQYFADTLSEEYQEKYEAFAEEFCNIDDGNASKRFVDIVFKNEQE